MAGLATDYAAQSATAAVITVNGDFSATSWEVYFGTPAAPIDPLTLKYSVTFDNAHFYEAASIITVISTNIPYAITFSWSPDIAPASASLAARFGAGLAHWHSVR